MFQLKCLPALVAIAFGAIAYADDPPDFPANHIFVCSTDVGELVEYDANHVFVQKVGVSGAIDAMFGPDGLLYISRGNDVVAVDSAFNVVRTYSDGGSPLDEIDFGMGGRLYATSPLLDTIAEFDPSGAFVDYRGLGGEPIGLEIDPAGNLYMAVFSPSLAQRVDIGGTNLQALGESALSNPFGLRFSSIGTLLVGDIDFGSIIELDVDGGVVREFGDAFSGAGLWNVIYGPDGNAYLPGAQSETLLILDTEESLIGEIGAEDGLVYPYGVAFAPFRLSATVKGVWRDSEGRVKVKENDAMLYLSPGQNKFFLQVVDDMTDDQDLASLTGYDRFVFTGFPQGKPTSAKHLFTGSSFDTSARAGGSAFASVMSKGTFDMTGNYVVESAKGDFHFSSPDGSFVGVITATVSQD